MKKWALAALAAVTVVSCANMGGDTKHTTIVPGFSVTDFDRGPTNATPTLPSGSPMGEGDQLR